MKIIEGAFTVRVVVRRIKAGVGPYCWEIHEVDTLEAIYVSPDSFIGMEAAFEAGQARLVEFIPKRSKPLGLHRELSPSQKRRA